MRIFGGGGGVITPPEIELLRGEGLQKSTHLKMEQSLA